jgi:hypothetical protein
LAVRYDSKHKSFRFAVRFSVAAAVATARDRGTMQGPRGGVTLT